MNHPFIHQPTQRLIYIILWLVLIVGQVGLVITTGSLEPEHAIADSLVYNLLLMFFSITPYYMINSIGNRFSIKMLATNILIPGIMLLAIWLVLAWQILLQLVNDATYQLFAFEALPYRFAFGLLIYTIITMVYLLLNSLRDIQVKNRRMNELNNLVRDAEINALKAQINPHFLFNSLNSIASLTLTAPGKAREMVVKLSEYMRYVIRRNEREMMALSEEMANINRYLDIEMIRFGDRIEVLNRMAPDCSKAQIPNMVLQPVFENAVKHGVYESSETIRIFTRCKLTPNELVMVIANNFDPEAKPAKGKGIGLENIRRRLMLQYNRSDLLQYGKLGNLFTVVLTIPQITSINDSEN